MRGVYARILTAVTAMIRAVRRHIELDTPAGRRAAPVYSLRSEADRALIARELAAGRSAAFYIGLFTIVKLLRPPWAEGTGGELFWQVKPARPRWSKLPMVVEPRHAIRFVDFARVHPALRHLQRREEWERLWAHRLPLHVISPLRQPLRFLHEAFRTTPGDLRGHAAAAPTAADRLIEAETASFFWLHDPDWNALARRVALSAPARSYLAGTSFNKHGQHPPYTLDELQEHVRDRGDLEFDLVVHDELIEQAGLHSSHTMVRLPLAGQEPELLMTRLGSVSAARLEQELGLPVRVLDSVAEASRQPGLTQADVESRIAVLHDLREAAAAAARRRPA
jgi:hypothetical protein